MYFVRAKSLLKNLIYSTKFKSYKAPFVVLIYFGLLPTFLFGFFGCLFLVFAGVAIDLFKTPVDYLTRVLRDEVKLNKENRFVGFVLYLISWPFIFFLYCFISVFSLFYAIAFFFTELAVYPFSTASFHFAINPFVLEDGTLVPRAIRENDSKIDLKLSLYGAINFVLWIVSFVILLVACGPLANASPSFLSSHPCIIFGGYFFEIAKLVPSALFLLASVLFHQIYNFFAFRK